MALSHDGADTEHVLAGLARVASPGLLPTIEAVRDALMIVNPPGPRDVWGGLRPLYLHMLREVGDELLAWASCISESGDLQRQMHVELLRILRNCEKGEVRRLLQILES